MGRFLSLNDGSEFTAMPMVSAAQTQQTLRRPAVVSGVGYWSGRASRVELRPAAAGAGVVFVRDDLPVPVRIPASVECRVDAVARTNLAVSGVAVHMVEHVLSALAGLAVTSCEIHVTAEELPGLDGSAQAYVDAIDAVGVEGLAAPVVPIVVDRVVRLGDDASWIEIGPPRFGGLTVDYELDYGHAAIGRQHLSLDVTAESYREHLAAARTFLALEEAERLQAVGLGLSVGHRDLLVFGPDGPIENTLRWADECVRHKMLDLVGDLSLAGRPLHATVRACRSGHRLNAAAAARALSNSRDAMAA
jgi:UDP-3-O-[3-hydroxymyristoyl] N-acetylglucosamine deacetylase